MIKEPTPEQLARVDEYIKRWTGIALSTKPINKKWCEAWMRLVYKISDLGQPKQIIFCDSPRDVIDKALEAGKEEGCNFEESDIAGNFCYGNHESHWLGVYDFYRNVCNERDKTFKIAVLCKLAQNCHWFVPFDDRVFISEKPVEFHTIKRDNGEIILHNATGPAILYKDGYARYILNGVLVTKEIVETPAEKIPIEWVARETNAEVRRELVRKVGIDRLIHELDTEILDDKEFASKSMEDGKIVDITLCYRLINLKLADGRTRPFLMMKNPSIDAWHVEGVPPDTKTVMEALEFRNKSKVLPEIIS